MTLLSLLTQSLIASVWRVGKAACNDGQLSQNVELKKSELAQEIKAASKVFGKYTSETLDRFSWIYYHNRIVQFIHE